MKIIHAVTLLLFLASQCFSTIASNAMYPLELLNSPVSRLPAVNKKMTQGDVRALVLLVQFSDIKFRNADPVSQFNDFLNKEGYNEYQNVGSVRDYFLKSSYGLFRPTFDVMAPVMCTGGWVPSHTIDKKTVLFQEDMKSLAPLIGMTLGIDANNNSFWALTYTDDTNIRVQKFLESLKGKIT